MSMSCGSWDNNKWCHTAGIGSKRGYSEESGCCFHFIVVSVEYCLVEARLESRDAIRNEDEERRARVLSAQCSVLSDQYGYCVSRVGRARKDHRFCLLTNFDQNTGQILAILPARRMMASKYWIPTHVQFWKDLHRHLHCYHDHLHYRSAHPPLRLIRSRIFSRQQWCSLLPIGLPKR